MEDSYNVDPNAEKDVKTSSTDSKENPKTTGDSQVQDGKNIEINNKKSYEKSDEQQEYVNDINNNTELSNEDPVQDGQGFTMLAAGSTDEDEEEDDDDDNDSITELGDDTDETEKKLPIMQFGRKGTEMPG